MENNNNRIGENIENQKRRIVLIGILSVQFQGSIVQKYKTLGGNFIETNITSEAALKGVVADFYKKDETEIEVFYLASKKSIETGALQNCVDFVNGVDSENIKLRVCRCSDEFKDEEIVGFMSDIASSVKPSDKVYVDFTAGQRSSSMFMMTIMRILQTKGIVLQSLVYSQIENFREPNSKAEIVDESSKYQMFDVISGVDEFIRYGRSDKLKTYFDSYRGEGQDMYIDLIDKVNTLADKLALCQLSGILHGVENVLSSLDNIYENGNISKFEKILLDMIESDIANILNEDCKVDLLKLISWCTTKRLIQPALAFIVEFMPIIFHRLGLFSIVQPEEMKKQLSEIEGINKQDYRTMVFLGGPNKCRLITYEDERLNPLRITYKKVKSSRNNLSHIGKKEMQMAYICNDINKIVEDMEEYRNMFEKEVFSINKGDVIFVSKYINSQEKCLPDVEIVQVDKKEKIIMQQCVDSQLETQCDISYEAVYHVQITDAVSDSWFGKLQEKPGKKVKLLAEFIRYRKFEEYCGKIFPCQIVKVKKNVYVVRVLKNENNN